MDPQKQKSETHFEHYQNYSPGHPIRPSVKPTKTSAINSWLHKHRVVVLILVLATAITLGGGIIYGFQTLEFYADGGTVTTKKVEKKIYSPLTGAETTEEFSKRPVTAIMIENSPEARPQSGLKESGIVFEAIAEGGITRFLVLYQEDQPELIGPVRSLRPYYVDWLAPFDPAVAHVGGSAKALAEIRNGDYKDIDQFFNASTYWRAKDRYAPHNVYSSFSRIDELNEKKGFRSSSFTGFKRKDDAKKAVLNATTITVPISGPLYNSSYAYDQTNGVYNRSQAGKPHLDREKGAIAPKVVIVMQATLGKVFEDGYRENYQTTGSGPVTVFQDGTAISGTWSKAGTKSQISFKDATGEEIELNRGQTWITVIDTAKTPTWQ